MHSISAHNYQDYVRVPGPTRSSDMRQFYGPVKSWEGLLSPVERSYEYPAPLLPITPPGDQDNQTSLYHSPNAPPLSPPSSPSPDSGGYPGGHPGAWWTYWSGYPQYTNVLPSTCTKPSPEPLNTTSQAQDAQIAAALLKHSHNMASRRCRKCKCPSCEGGTTNKDGEEKKRYPCHVPGCVKVFGKTSQLKAHLRWHAGDRPFSCGWMFCGKSFTRSDELQRHLRTHTGEKRFACNECGKRFTRSDHLNKHIKTHAKKEWKMKANVDVLKHEDIENVPCFGQWNQLSA